MPKEKTSKQSRPAMKNKKRGMVISVALLFTLLVAGGGLAQWAGIVSLGQKHNKKPSGEVVPESLIPSSPSKEYIYAGGRLVATEEPVHGTNTVGLYNPAGAAFFLRNSNDGGVADISFTYGPTNFTPIVGDWNGDGVDTIGLYNPVGAAFFLRNTNTGGVTVEIVSPVKSQRSTHCQSHSVGRLERQRRNHDEITTIGRGRRSILRPAL